MIRDGLVMLSWREHIGSTIVHVLDYLAGQAYIAVTPVRGEKMRAEDAFETPWQPSSAPWQIDAPYLPTLCKYKTLSEAEPTSGE